MAEAVFELGEVTYSYGKVTALDACSLTVRPGERVAVLGANGSGKSTLLRVLDGLYFPAAGVVRAFGAPLDERSFEDDRFTFDFRRRVGLVFQNPDVQLFNPTVFDEVAFGPLQLRWGRDKILVRVGEALDRMEIADLRHRPPHRLSGGEKKRVALASVLVLDPDVLLLDEPTAALDPKSASHIVDLLVEWAGRKTVILATHDLHALEEIADRCIVFERGRIVADGAPGEILSDTPLLERTNLVHRHRHRHASGEAHIHPHGHRGHDH